MKQSTKLHTTVKNSQVNDYLIDTVTQWATVQQVSVQVIPLIEIVITPTDSDEEFDLEIDVIEWEQSLKEQFPDLTFDVYIDTPTHQGE